MEFDAPQSDHADPLHRSRQRAGSGVWERVWLVLRFAAVIIYVLLIAIGLANAQVTDRVSFKIEKRVIVWAGSSGAPLDPRGFQGRVQPRSVVQTASASPVISGQLMNVSVDRQYAVADHALESAFYVASNAAFDIKAQWTGAARDAQHVSMAMGIDVAAAGFGQAAQHPAPSGFQQGFTAASWSLADLSSPRIVFRGQRKTAAASGAIEDQSVRFEARFWGDSSQAAVQQAAGEVVFTIFCP